MEKKILQDIINKAIENLNKEHDLILTNFLQILHRNIDILSNNADKWFPDEIPEQYKKALKSLMTLSFVYFEEKGDFIGSIIENRQEEVLADTFFTTILNDIKSLYEIKKIFINNKCKNPPVIKTSVKLLKDSLYNIYLSISQFASSDTEYSVTISDNASNIIIDLEFKNMADDLPGTYKLSRKFFSYFDGAEYHIYAGIGTAVENLRSIGSSVIVKQLGLKNSFIISILFPSQSFLNTLDDLRAEEKNSIIKNRDEEVLLCVEDIIIEMVTREALHDDGYKTTKVDISDLINSKSCGKDKFLIIACKNILDNFPKDKQLLDLFKGFKRVIIIYNQEDNNNLQLKMANLFFLKKPFQVDSITDILDEKNLEK